MAPRVKNSTQDMWCRDHPYRRLDDDTKKKTFFNRINFEKSLPLKKRLFPIEIRLTKPRFKPAPYEKPVTRSQRRRSSVTSKTANKENLEVSTDNQKKCHSDNGKRRSSGRKPVPKVPKVQDDVQTSFAPKVNEMTTPITPVKAAIPIPIQTQMTTDVNVDTSIYALNYFDIDSTDAFKLKYFLLS